MEGMGESLGAAPMDDDASLPDAAAGKGGPGLPERGGDRKAARAMSWSVDDEKAQQSTAVAAKLAGARKAFFRKLPDGTVESEFDYSYAPDDQHELVITL